MDSIVHVALEEICSQGVAGLTLPNLWAKLHSPLSSRGLHLCPNVKKALWANLIAVPGLQFESLGVSYKPQDEIIQSFETSEKLNLKIVAAEHLRNSFVGIYDVKASDAGISQPQQRALERLAIARTNGITQSELAKEFGIKGNNIFYILRNLECRGLIVRQSTIVRKKEACSEGELKNSSIVSTNMLHLYRYAKHLGCQQRIEITKEDKTLVGYENGDGSVASGEVRAEECVKEDVRVKDYLPALKAICDKLEKADGKVLVVSDIKQDLGYRGTPGHRAWRNISHRLKDARIVEEFCGKVNKREVSCLRLLKKFSPKHFEPKTLGCGQDDLDTEQSLKLAKRGQFTDQLVELPIEHQIYDMIDSEGSKGLTITEVCKRLGISNKRYYTRLLNMFTRFGMHLEAESHNRGVAYRVWTSGNFNAKTLNILPGKPEKAFSENDVCIPRVRDLDFQGKEPQTIQEVVHSTSKCDATVPGENGNVVIEPELSHALPVDGESNNNNLLNPSSAQNSAHEVRGVVPNSEFQIVSTAVSDVAQCEMSPPALSTQSRRRSYQTYPCLNLSALSAQREQRILEMLQEEKFIIKAELHRHLENLEKDKHTMMDRKTLERSLIKLQQEGHCKCISVGVPVVTNCGRSRTTVVVLHPSVFNVSPELLGQIHERLRSFEMQVRAQSSSRLKKGQQVSVLDGVQRIINDVKLDAQSERSEAMRANGFVLAKMVRTKLLHIFLWGYIRSLPGWDDALSSGKHGYDMKNPHSTCKLFELDAAVKAIPLELFLQVVGSTHKFDDMIEKCRAGLCLSDLPVQEYKHFMDTQATGRLSNLINILRRLKLIRMVSGGHSEEAAKVPHATLAHSLELKPYIEEPVAIVLPPSAIISFDLRPQVRHDFALSSREAVDEYWNTLEYCYAAADSKAALHAFPGSAVHEVFLFRSWASVRVMTADQRAKLLKRIVNNHPNKKLSFKECEKIAKDLNLTLEQVLRVYYDKRQQRLTRFQGVLNGKKEFQPLKSRHALSPRKRKRSSEGRSSNHVKVDTTDEHSGEQGHAKVSDANDQHSEEQNLLSSSTGEHGNHLQSYHVDDHMKAVDEPGFDEEDEEDHSFIRKCALSTLKSSRQRKFSWTEKADRQLVIEYLRHRAALGAKFHRTDWASLPNLPAPLDTCKRRMALLNSSIPFRKAVMRLCNMLSDRYANHLAKFQNQPLNPGDCRMMVRDYSFGADCNRNISDSSERTEEFDLEERWDDFDNKTIKVALGEVMRYKRIAKLDAPDEVGSVSEECSNLNMNADGHDPQVIKFVSSTSPSKEVQDHGGRSKVSARRSACHRIPRKYIKLLNEGLGVSRRAYESLAVSTAAELFKLIFLSTSTAPEVPNLLAETLRRYSEHDLFAAFNYLREKKIMVGGSGTSPFVLSQQFLQSLSSSPFPTNTGKRATKFASWLHEREEDLMEEGIDLTADLQCGDIFHLCALVSSGEILVSPCLPDEGVGETEDLRNLKRKPDNSESGNGDKSKKLKPSLAGEGEIISRREKGFPGIRLSLNRATMSRCDVMKIFKDGDLNSVAFPFGDNYQVNSMGLDVGSSASYSDPMKIILNSGSTNPTALLVSESPWNAMTCYAEHLISLSTKQEQESPFYPELFRTVYSAIQKAGDQGLSIEEISQVINIQGEKMPELITEVLEAFGQALKVNAFDSIHVVDSLYLSKYFLTSTGGLRQELKVAPLKNPKEIIVNEHLILQRENHRDDVPNLQKEISMNADEVHRVTILNLPEEVAEPSGEIQSFNEMEDYMQDKVISPGKDREGETFKFQSGDSHFCRPILPWINGDGSINEVVYKGLVRRALGIVMQNPGILEDDILSQMHVLNLQSCRNLLQLMILDNHIFVRKMHQTTSGEPPAILGCLLGSRFKKSKLICREHFFANPMSTTFL